MLYFWDTIWCLLELGENNESKIEHDVMEKITQESIRNPLDRVLDSIYSHLELYSHRNHSFSGAEGAAKIPRF